MLKISKQARILYLHQGPGNLTSGSVPTKMCMQLDTKGTQETDILAKLDPEMLTAP